jgi:hypothetical protein
MVKIYSYLHCIAVCYHHYLLLSIFLLTNSLVKEPEILSPLLPKPKFGHDSRHVSLNSHFHSLTSIGDVIFLCRFFEVEIVQRLPHQNPAAFPQDCSESGLRFESFTFLTRDINVLDWADCLVCLTY